MRYIKSKYFIFNHVLFIFYWSVFKRARVCMLIYESGSRVCVCVSDSDISNNKNVSSVSINKSTFIIFEQKY